MHKDINDLDNQDGEVNSLVARHPGEWSQMGLKKYYCK